MCLWDYEKRLDHEEWGQKSSCWNALLTFLVCQKPWLLWLPLWCPGPLPEQMNQAVLVSSPRSVSLRAGSFLEAGSLADSLNPVPGTVPGAQLKLSALWMSEWCKFKNIHFKFLLMIPRAREYLFMFVIGVCNYDCIEQLLQNGSYLRWDQPGGAEEPELGYWALCSVCLDLEKSPPRSSSTPRLKTTV